MRPQFPFLVLVALALLSPPSIAADTPPAEEHDCLIEARQEVTVRSPVDAMIDKINVERGDSVTKGQVVAVLSSGPERAAVNLAKSRASAQGELKLAETRRDLAARKLARSEELFRQNFISINARDEAAADFRLAQEQVQQAHENLEMAELEHKRAGEVLRQREIRSPLTGVVVDVVQKPGEYAGSNAREPIMKLAQIDPLYVEVILPVSLYGSVHVGDQAQVSPEAPVGGHYETTVRVVDRAVDAASGTFGVRLVLANPKGAIPAGIKCRVRF